MQHLSGQYHLGKVAAPGETAQLEPAIKRLLI